MRLFLDRFVYISSFAADMTYPVAMLRAFVRPEILKRQFHPARERPNLLVISQTIKPTPPRSIGKSGLPDVTERTVACVITRIARAQPIQ
jgi:hypothetical protein